MLMPALSLSAALPLPSANVQRSLVATIVETHRRDPKAMVFEAKEAFGRTFSNAYNTGLRRRLSPNRAFDTALWEVFPGARPVSPIRTFKRKIGGADSTRTRVISVVKND